MDMPGGLPTAEFLRDYWQQKPRLIRQAFSGFRCPVSADELAGLACEEAVDSRLVMESEARTPRQIHNGPFTPERFATLPENHWALLVAGLDHWVPEIADLLEHFRFVPNWHLDDILASYAPKGSRVVPHFGQHDVFLLQAQGRRRYTLGGADLVSPEAVPGGLDGEQTVTLSPGDLLYLPPDSDHQTVAEDDCISLWIGFRTPSMDDILTGFTDFLCSRPGASEHFSAPAAGLQDNPGTITAEVVEQLHSLIQRKLNDKRQLALWFGQFTTAPKSLDIVVPAEEPLTAEQFHHLVTAGQQLRWNEGSRFAYHELDSTETALFVDGEQYLLRGEARQLAPLICVAARPDMAELGLMAADDALCGLLTNLYNQGSLYFE